MHDLDSAATYIERALALNPNHAPNWIYSGWAHVFLGLNDVEVEHLSKAGRLSPIDWQSARIGVAMTAAHYFAGRYEEACAWINKVLTDIETPTALLSPLQAQRWPVVPIGNHAAATPATSRPSVPCLVA